MLNEIFALDKRLAIANHRLLSTFPDYPFVHGFIDSHLRAYVEHYGLDIHAVVQHYHRFAQRYAAHLEKFQDSGLYPYQYGDTATVDKTCYDIALILSCVSNPARYEIVHNLNQVIQKIGIEKTGANIAVVGVGAGIELALIKQFAPGTQVSAYDLAIDPFVKNQFGLFTLHQENFLDAEGLEQFDVFFAIELLEHVTDYEQLLRKISQNLKPKGQLICTTATNMPQFDHVHNFKDMELFVREVTGMGFTILEHRQFRQPHNFHGIDARNDWFVLEK